MELQNIHCFLVHPSKHSSEQPKIVGTSVPKQGKMYLMLKKIYDNAEEDCRIDISFNHDADGKQQNECRDLLLKYTGGFKTTDGNKVALRLQKVTNEKSGLGLFFLMSGKTGNKVKLILSRFPADEGIYVEENQDKLTVKFIEKVFLKNAAAYKAVLYRFKDSGDDFWSGQAIDKQIANSQERIANYWIRDFLLSDLKTTAAAGSRRLAVAIKDAMKVLALEEKAQLSAAVTLASNMAGQTISAKSFCTHFKLSEPITEAINKAIRHDQLMSEHFVLDASEFSKHLTLRTIELNNGGIVSAEATKFDDIFKQKSIDDKGTIQITTSGKITDERFRKSKL